MSFEDVVALLAVVAYVAVWIAAFVSYFRTPQIAWASDLERLLMLAGLIFLGWIGAGAWFFAVRPILRDRLAELGSDEPPTDDWRLKHLT